MRGHWGLTSPLNAAGDNSPHEVALQEDKEDEDRQGGYHSTGEDLSPVGQLAGNRVYGNRYLDQLVILRLNNDQRPQERVPGEQESHQRGGREGRPYVRDYD